MSATIESLAWMTGPWHCEIWGGIFEEFWTPPHGGTMLGCGRHIANGKATFMEFLTIEPSIDGLKMWIIVGSPSKGDRKGVPFPLVRSTEHSAFFENKENEFPSRISYTWIEEGRMDCVIEGVRSGERCFEEFKFVRMPQS